MNGVTKFIIGGVATSLLAMVGHAATGEAFIDGLQAKADARLAEVGATGVTALFGRDMLNRNLVLSGDAPEADRARIVAALRTIPGVGAISWAGDGGRLGADAAGAAAAGATAGAEAGASTVAAETPAAPEAVADCQADVDAAIAGKTIQFDTAQATIKPESGALLDALAAGLKDCAGTTVEIAGHTDAQGDAAANQALSERRAEAVAAALTARGLPAGRMKATGYGETRPKVTGGAEANAENRRIEFTVASGAAAAGQ